MRLNTELQLRGGGSAQIPLVADQMASGIDLGMQQNPSNKNDSTAPYAAEVQFPAMVRLSSANEASHTGEGYDSFPPLVENKRLERMMQAFHATFDSFKGMVIAEPASSIIH